VPRKTDLDLDGLRARLIAHRDELLADEAQTAPDRAVVDAGDTAMGRLSRMDALQQQAMAQATGRRRQLELTRIESALTRIETGEYGLCVQCGNEISAKRLDFDPSVPLCIDCAGGPKG